MSENKKDTNAKKIKRGAIMTGVAIGMGASFVLNLVVGSVSKVIEKKSKKKDE